MTFGDSIDAINGAVDDAKRAGHELSGFTRRTGTFGYRFVAQCRRCAEEVVIRRGSAGWEYAAVEPVCPGGAP